MNQKDDNLFPFLMIVMTMMVLGTGIVIYTLLNTLYNFLF